ncbi:MAG: hypothetical protein F6K31_13225 [Symploca sp. SIO2G7]|nr:hypothetical protein [Symploca sp. SIO2G7]
MKESDVKLKDLYPQLKTWFPPEAHKLRKLPGGGKWYFVPWQKMRDRLDEIYPDWEIDYSDPVQRGEQVVVKCHLTIAGVTRVGFGNSHAEFDDWNEEKKQRGTPEERVIACAFKRAMEQFGMCRYLDIQTNNEKHTEQEREQLNQFIKYMGRRSPSDRRDNQDPGAYNLAYRNGWIKDRDGNPAKNSYRKLQASKPKPKPQTARLQPANQGTNGSQPKPQLGLTDLYPQHNRLVKDIRSITGHQPQSIVDWCQRHGAQRPSQVPSDVIEELLSAMISGWLEVTKGLKSSEAITVVTNKLHYLRQNQGITSADIYQIALDELQQLKPKEAALSANN